MCKVLPVALCRHLAGREGAEKVACRVYDGHVLEEIRRRRTQRDEVVEPGGLDGPAVAEEQCRLVGDAAVELVVPQPAVNVAAVADSRDVGDREDDAGYGAGGTQNGPEVVRSQTYEHRVCDGVGAKEVGGVEGGAGVEAQALEEKGSGGGMDKVGKQERQVGQEVRVRRALVQGGAPGTYAGHKHEQTVLVVAQQGVDCGRTHQHVQNLVQFTSDAGGRIAGLIADVAVSVDERCQVVLSSKPREQQRREAQCASRAAHKVLVARRLRVKERTLEAGGGKKARPGGRPKKYIKIV
mmetsp:Transcript_20099/g.34615  ORF Transcript_20099/g.34615 Transcript_20099/m.34615 type:complete len:296 (-) Transcript_20099:185-1072(-)